MLSVKFDNSETKKILTNAVDYSYGFLDGIDIEKIHFNKMLGGYAAEALGKYIDAKARSNPQSLHHVYEWQMTGNERGRLFKFNVNATKTLISINGTFLPSKVPSPTSDQIFANKAEIMENSIAIVIEPKSSDVLVFESEDETVFTRKTIIIEHPGGDEVAGSFGEIIDTFFTNYFTNSLLKPFIADLENAKEYIQNFNAGTKGGKTLGVRAGRQYLKMSGVVFE